MKIAVTMEKHPAIKTDINEANPTQSEGCLSNNDIISRHPSILYLLLGTTIGLIASIPLIMIMLIYILRR